MKYSIEITDNQLNLMIKSLEIYARSLMCQYDIVTDLLADDVFEYDADSPDCHEKFSEWLSKRELARIYMKDALISLFGDNCYKLDSCQNLIDMWHVLRHQQWLNIPEDERATMGYDVRSYAQEHPYGSEPMMHMESINDD